MSQQKYLIEVKANGRLWENVNITISDINAKDVNGKPMYYLINMKGIGTFPQTKHHSVEYYRIIEGEDAESITAKYVEIHEKKMELAELIRASKRRKPKVSDFPDHPHPEHQVKRIR